MEIILLLSPCLSKEFRRAMAEQLWLQAFYSDTVWQWVARTVPEKAAGKEAGEHVHVSSWSLKSSPCALSARTGLGSLTAWWWLTNWDWKLQGWVLPWATQKLVIICSPDSKVTYHHFHYPLLANSSHQSLSKGTQSSLFMGRVLNNLKTHCWAQWYMPVIPATPEAKAGRSQVQGQAGLLVRPFLRGKIQKGGWGLRVWPKR
jgi:hypothetical protein